MFYRNVKLRLFGNWRNAGEHFLGRAERDGFIVGSQQLAEPLDGRLAKAFDHSPRSHLADG